MFAETTPGFKNRIGEQESKISAEITSDEVDRLVESGHPGWPLVEGLQDKVAKFKRLLFGPKREETFKQLFEEMISNQFPR